LIVAGKKSSALKKLDAPLEATQRCYLHQGITLKTAGRVGRERDFRAGGYVQLDAGTHRELQGYSTFSGNFRGDWTKVRHMWRFVSKVDETVIAYSDGQTIREEALAWFKFKPACGIANHRVVMDLPRGKMFSCALL